MTTLDETAMTEDLDRRGLLDDASGPGCYALRVDVPDNPMSAKTAWDAHHDARPGENALARAAVADQVAYVGASGHVYDRLCDHADGTVRQPAFLAAFDAEAVVDVWPFDHPFQQEYTMARALADQGWAVWTDGVLIR